MEIDNIQVALRPRPPYEGLDLGFVMASRWFPKLWGLWVMVALPLALIGHLICKSHLPWALFLLWWLKPLYELPLLYFLSRYIFNEKAGLLDSVRSLKHIPKHRIIAALTLKRLSPSRSFYMPVLLLEKLSGTDYQKRVDVLDKNQSAGMVLTFICLLFELALLISGITLFEVILPKELLQNVHIGQLFSQDLFSRLSGHVLVFLSMSVIGPYYTAGGFALYLTRRTMLEAWDIELNFKRLINRKKEKQTMGTKGVLLTVLMLTVMSTPAHPDTISTADKQQAQETIQDILKRDDFGHKEKVTQWRLRNVFPQNKSDYKQLPWMAVIEKIAEFVAKGFRVILWGLGGTVVAVLIYYGGRSLGHFSLPQPTKTVKPAGQLFGLDMTQDQIPEDIIAEVNQRLAAKDIRAALRLLYRGTLYKLVYVCFIEIPDSATEGECISIVESGRESHEAQFFKELTQVWLKMAYGHKLPEASVAENFRDRWIDIYK